MNTKPLSARVMITTYCTAFILALTSCNTTRLATVYNSNTPDSSLSLDGYRMIHNPQDYEQIGIIDSLGEMKVPFRQWEITDNTKGMIVINNRYNSICLTKDLFIIRTVPLEEYPSVYSNDSRIKYVEGVQDNQFIVQAHHSKKFGYKREFIDEFAVPETLVDTIFDYYLVKDEGISFIVKDKESQGALEYLANKQNGKQIVNQN